MAATAESPPEEEFPSGEPTRAKTPTVLQMQVTEGQLELNRQVTALVLETLARDGLAEWARGADTNE